MARRLRETLGEKSRTIPRRAAEALFRASPTLAAWVRTAAGEPSQPYPPGHFYSPIPDVRALRSEEARVFAPERALPGVELNEPRQRAWLERFVEIYPSIPFTAEKTDRHRYYYENPFYSYSDAIVLHCMLRILKPRRVIEVGSGFSSAVTLDTNEAFLDGAADLTFVEPHPERLLELCRAEERGSLDIVRKRVQDVDPSLFETLGANDVLFIDSTHVSKAGSDVNHLFFEVLPRLARGVYVHFHDVFHPFEYPKHWVYEGRSWNEIYALHAFLQFNRAFEVAFFQSMMLQRHRETYERSMPLCLRNGGGNIWLQRVA